MGLESIQTCFSKSDILTDVQLYRCFFKALIHPRNFAHSIKRLTFTCPFCFFFQSLVFVFWRQARAYRASDTAPLRSRAIRQIKQLKKIATVIALLATTSDKARALLRPMPSRSKRKRSWPQWLWMAKRTCCGNGRKNSRNRKKNKMMADIVQVMGHTDIFFLLAYWSQVISRQNWRWETDRKRYVTPVVC